MISVNHSITVKYNKICFYKRRRSSKSSLLNNKGIPLFIIYNEGHYEHVILMSYLKSHNLFKKFDSSKKLRLFLIHNFQNPKTLLFISNYLSYLLFVHLLEKN